VQGAALRVHQATGNLTDHSVQLGVSEVSRKKMTMIKKSMKTMKAKMKIIIVSRHRGID